VPSKKQRRRRQKERRHEWEYVYVDGEGQEVEAEESAPPAGAKPKPNAKQAPAKGTRTGRVVEPPSWRRVGRRALFLAPVLVALIYFTSRKDQGTPQILLTTLFFLLVFLPFSYVMDTMLYRSYLKRTGQAPAARQRPPSQRPPKEPKAKA
jgi:hypothetical protein